jgi:ATP-binding cassette subfamily B protein
MAADSHEHAHPSPVARLRQLVSQERADLYVLLVYTVITGVFSLAVPLAAQALVNTIAAGMFQQPLIVLTLGVLAGLLIAGVLNLLQLSLVEVLQQRFFAQVALRVAERLSRVKQSAFSEAYAPELVNRFFDVLTIQKTAAKLLLDGLAALLSAAVGLILLAFYSPLLLGFDLFIVLFVLFVIVVLGYRGLRTSIDESIQKYRVVDWLEEIARCQTSLKLNGVPGYLVDRADALVVAYIKARRRHFAVTWRQTAGTYFFQAVTASATLGIGGWLVINNQLSLGQLVAAELIVMGVLSNIEKLLKQAEQLYDLLTGLDKVGHVTDLPLERIGGVAVPQHPSGGAEVECRAVHFAYREGVPVLNGLNLHVLPGQRVSLVGRSGAGKSTLAALMVGLEDLQQGIVEVNGIDVRNADLISLREVVDVVADTLDIFDGTIEENIRVGRKELTYQDIDRALEITGLTDDMAMLPEGIRTRIISSGRNLSRGQIQRLLIARSVVAKPQLLILDEAFTGIDERTKLEILDRMYDRSQPWTIIDISHDAEVVSRADIVHLLKDGIIAESGSPQSLCSDTSSAMTHLFPDMAEQHSRAQARTRRSRT